MDEYIKRKAALEECDWYANEFCECEYAIMPLKGALEIIPAADVRPVVKAQWINLTPPKYREAGNSIFWMCSECKSAACFMAEDLPYSFCPNCGAIMMEES